MPPPPETEVEEEDMEEDDVAFPVPDAGDPALPIDMTSLCAAYKGAAAAEAWLIATLQEWNKISKLKVKVKTYQKVSFYLLFQLPNQKSVT